MKFGRDPVGSPTKIALVSRSMAVAVFCAAEKVCRPMMTNSVPGRLTAGQALKDRGGPQEPRDHERDLLLVVPDDDGIEGRDGFGDGAAADLLHLGPEQVPEPGAGRDDEQALGEQEEIDREQAGEVLVLGPAAGRPDPGVAVIEVAHQFHHADQDLGIGEAGDVVIELSDAAVELFLRDEGERRVRPALDLAGQQPQVGAPALLARHAVGVDEPEQVLQALVVMPRLPVLVVPGPAQVTEAPVEGHGQRADRLVALPERGQAARDAVRDLAGQQLGQVLAVLRLVPGPDAELSYFLVRLVRRDVLLAGEPRLGQASPVVSVDRVLRRHLGPEGRRLGPVTGCRPQFGPGHDGEEITRLDHARSSLRQPACASRKVKLYLEIRAPSTASAHRPA